MIAAVSAGSDASERDAAHPRMNASCPLCLAPAACSDAEGGGGSDGTGDDTWAGRRRRVVTTGRGLGRQPGTSAGLARRAGPPEIATLRGVAQGGGDVRHDGDCWFQTHDRPDQRTGGRGCVSGSYVSVCAAPQRSRCLGAVRRQDGRDGRVAWARQDGRGRRARAGTPCRPAVVAAAPGAGRDLGRRHAQSADRMGKGLCSGGPARGGAVSSRISS
jgi:hypothetical protein